MKQLNSLQALRALAAAMVLIGHTIAEAEHYFNIQLPAHFLPWTRGVDLFFVISGFIIYYASRNLHQTPNARKTFITRRIIRVVPLYFLFTTLMVCALIFIPSGIKDTQQDIQQIIFSYLFIPYERYDGRIAPVLSLGWTVNYEIFFYLAFALVITFSKRTAIKLLTLGFVCLIILGHIFEPQSAPLKSWTNSIILEFCFGIYIAAWYCRYGSNVKVTSMKPAAYGILLGLFLLTVGYWLTIENIIELPRFISAGIPASIIVASAVLLIPGSRQQATPKWVLALGDSSYSLYLSHRFVLRPATLIWLSIFPLNGISAVLYIIAVTILALLVGYICYLAIERPTLRVLRSRYDKRKVLI